MREEKTHDRFRTSALSLPTPRLPFLVSFLLPPTSKAFLEAGKRQLNGDTIREAGSDEVKELRTENDSLKMLVAELTLRNRTLKKTLQGLESESIDT